MGTMVGDHAATKAPIYRLPDPAEIADVNITNDDGAVDHDPVSLGPAYGKYQIRWFNQTAHEVTVTLDYQYEDGGAKDALARVVVGAPKSPFPGAVFVIPPGVGVTSGPIRNDLLADVHYFKYSVQTYRSTNDPRVIINR